MSASEHEPPDRLAQLLGPENELLELAGALDEPVARDPFKLAVLGLACRARTLFRGFINLQGASTPGAARALVRPMIEINILIRFLAKDPDLHVDLWQAEGERTALAMVEEHNRLHSERWGGLELDDSLIEERRATITAARKRAIEAGLPGAERGGALLPSTVQQLGVIEENAASEAYTLAYRPMSWEIHSGAQALQNGTFEERNDGSVSYTEEALPEDMLGPRALSLTTFASTLELAAMHLELAVEADARRIRRAFVPDAIPAEQRVEALQSDGDTLSG